MSQMQTIDQGTRGALVTWHPHSPSPSTSALMTDAAQAPGRRGKRFLAHLSLRVLNTKDGRVQMPPTLVDCGVADIARGCCLGAQGGGFQQDEGSLCS